jgi:biopolymer transport protein TolR
MGMGVASGGGGRGRGRRRQARQMAEINVTPMVDVMLVLLIIFMVAAPLLTVGVPVNLPQTKANALNDNDQKPLEISINAKGQIFIQETPVDMDSLVPKLQAMSNNNHDINIYVRGDKDMNYGTFLQVMGAVTGGGFAKVSLLSNPANGKPHN